ncbi:MAG: GH3 auxin-responsive promoter family protein [Bacteroidales bacterium]|jgi:phenylacetate-coenzyme A ligase PaaK-like adenylate-forming protein|nr:GH3 auxin-responsive promoter family protein [Bacteroidales bacterium]
MSLINSIVNSFNAGRLKKIERFKKNPGLVQEKMWAGLIKRAKDTEWGKQYDFNSIRNIKDFQDRLPLQTYEDIKPYVDRIREGKDNILWPGSTRWFAKSSGTTGNKSKFIPVTREALIKCHYQGGRDVLAVYAKQNPKTRVFTGRTLTLGGSHQIDNVDNRSLYGDLSAILIQNVPRWVNLLRTPPSDIALLGDFEKKLELITEISVRQHVVGFTGVPSWNMVLMKHILERTGKQHIMEVWPDMELFIHGGVSFTPYREQYEKLFPSDNMHYFETYNASEGFFALQDDPDDSGMLLMLDYHVFFEFIPLNELGKESPEVLTIDQVETGKNYAIVISTNGGLWRYMIGDTVTFTSLYPHKIKISGRTRQYINAFGEEIIVDNAEKALHEACKTTGAIISEYTAGPVYMDQDNNGAHEWLIEFEKEPDDLSRFTQALDQALCSLNSDYEAKRNNNITLRMPIVRSMPKGSFYNWMRNTGKLGGQNKVPRLANDRKYIEDILGTTVAK